MSGAYDNISLSLEVVEYYLPSLLEVLIIILKNFGSRRVRGFCLYFLVLYQSRLMSKFLLKFKPGSA